MGKSYSLKERAWGLTGLVFQDFPTNHPPEKEGGQTWETPRTLPYRIWTPGRRDKRWEGWAQLWQDKGWH